MEHIVDAEAFCGPQEAAPYRGLDMDAAVSVLRGHGQRVTALKHAVLEQFAGRECALTAEELGARLGLGGDLSPLYRCLAALEQAGILTHLYLHDGNRRYDLSDSFGRHHHHMVCELCERVLRVEGCVLAPDAAQRLDEDGLLIQEHQVTMRGICAGCRGAAERPAADVGRPCADDREDGT